MLYRSFCKDPILALAVFVVIPFCQPAALAQEPVTPPAETQQTPALTAPVEPIYRWPNPITFSEGYALGHATTPSATGMVIKFFDTQIHLGVGSVPAALINDNCRIQQLESLAKNPKLTETDRLKQAENRCSEPINPFVLSSYDSSWREYLSTHNPDLALYKFTGYIAHPFLNSPYIIEDVVPTNPSFNLPSESMDESQRFAVYPKIHYGRSQYDGRVVVASLDGIVRRHFQIVMQIGRAGGHFERLNVPTRRLFNYIVDCMATGRLLRVYYYVLYGPQAWPSNLLHGYTTNLRVYRVDVIGDQDTGN